MFSLSAIMGVMAFANFQSTDRYLRAVERGMRQQGKKLTVDGCVDAVVTWRKGCQGARVLCDSFAPRVMRACLEARDRRAYCAKLPPLTEGPRFGWRDCQRRGVTRKTKKACAAAFRMVHIHCRGGRRRDG